MKADTRFAQILPFYLAVQGTILVTTFLDFPVYVMDHRNNHFMTVTPWAAAWLVLLIFGLVFGASALLNKSLSGSQRWKISAGYLFGALAGFVTLGIRFMPVMPREYFPLLGLLTLLFAAAFGIFKLRLSRQEELFP